MKKNLYSIIKMNSDIFLWLKELRMLSGICKMFLKKPQILTFNLNSLRIMYNQMKVTGTKSKTHQ